MLSPWLADQTARAHLELLNEAVDFDLLEAGSTWESERIRDTRIAQPLIFASSLVAAYAAIDAGAQPTAASGHSVGEWCASVVAGALSAHDAIRLVAARGVAMAQACEQGPTGLAAVLGGTRADVVDVAQRHGLVIANDNGPGQLVVGGPIDQLTELIAAPPSGARVRRLDVAGAFHTDAMRPAVATMATLASTVTTNEASIPVYSNRDGASLTDGQQILDQMIEQIALPVRWDLVMDSLESVGATAAVELCPAGSLRGILRRRLPQIETHLVNIPSDTSSLAVSDLRTTDLAGVSQ